MPYPEIFLNAYDCVTPAGQGVALLLESLFAERTHLHPFRNIPQGALPPAINEILDSLQAEKLLRNQDRTSLIAVHLARTLMATAAMVDRTSTGVILGSSRGSTHSLEKAWQAFREKERLHPSTSPSTTASSLAAVVARDLQLEGPSFSLSAACSTGLYAVLQGVAGLLSGQAETMLVGGIEAANTDFTFAMLRAAKVLNPNLDEEFPCRPGHPSRAGMVLSEGGALLSLSLSRQPHSKSKIIGWGAATESGTLTGVSEGGEALSAAITKAFRIAEISSHEVDFIVGHGAGTYKGDNSERAAYHAHFTDLPPLVWHKWCSGHMLGASAALSVMLATEHLVCGKLPPHPYLNTGEAMRPALVIDSPKIALVTSMGFGGSACALLVKNLI